MSEIHHLGAVCYAARAIWNKIDAIIISPFVEEETVAQRGYVSCPKAHSQ